jgi:hypothetical protein
MNILELPQDITQSIFDNLDITTLYHLQKTCKSYNNIIKQSYPKIPRSKKMIGYLLSLFNTFDENTQEECRKYILYRDIITFLVKYNYWNMIRILHNINYISDYESLLSATCIHCNISEIKYVLSLNKIKFDEFSDVDELFNDVCARCDLNIVKFISNLAHDHLTKRDNDIFHGFNIACNNNNIDVAKWIYETYKSEMLHATILMNSLYIFEECVKFGHFDTASWIYDTFKININQKINSAQYLLDLSFNNGNVKTIKWLCSLDIFRNVFFHSGHLYDCLSHGNTELCEWLLNKNIKSMTQHNGILHEAFKLCCHQSLDCAKLIYSVPNCIRIKEINIIDLCLTLNDNCIDTVLWLMSIGNINESNIIDSVITLYDMECIRDDDEPIQYVSNNKTLLELCDNVKLNLSKEVNKLICEMLIKINPNIQLLVDANIFRYNICNKLDEDAQLDYL